jgi:hypothetical protein
MNANQQLLERLRKLHARMAVLAAIEDDDCLVDLKADMILDAEIAVGNLEAAYLGKRAG